MESYTQEFSNYILDLPDREIAAIWEDIESMPLDTTAELWRRKLQKIYTYLLNLFMNQVKRI